MKTRLLTIKTDDQEAYEQLLSNWLAADATIIQCGFDNRDLEWWAIAKIDPMTPEKPCDIIRRTVTRDEFPEGHWMWGDELEHNYYYDFPMFSYDVNEIGVD